MNKFTFRFERYNQFSAGWQVFFAETLLAAILTSAFKYVVSFRAEGGISP